MDDYSMRRVTRIRLLLLLNILAVLFLIAATGIEFREPYFLRIPRVTPDRAALADPDAVALCKAVHKDLDDGNFAALDSRSIQFRDLRQRLRGAREKLFLFYAALSQNDCTDRSSCTAEQFYPRRVQAVQRWLNQAPKSVPAHIAMAEIWHSYAVAARHCHGFPATTFDEWQAFYDRVRIAHSYLDNLESNVDPQIYPVALKILRDSGGSRAEIDALFAQGHEAYPHFLSLVALYASILDPSWYGNEGDLGRLAETVRNDSGVEDGEMAYAIVAGTAAMSIPYPHLFLETGLTWQKTKAGLDRIEKRYGNSNYDWNLGCYMALVAIDRPAALAAYRHFEQNWDPAVWNNADYFYGQALPWITYGQ